jgi:V8-like Glu-specific endopeptidase
MMAVAYRKMNLQFAVVGMLCGILATGALAAEGKVTQQGAVTSFTPAPEQKGAADTIDYNSTKSKMPQVDTSQMHPYTQDQGAPAKTSEGQPAVEPGFHGNGKTTPERLPLIEKEGAESSAFDEVVPQEYGSKNIPFTTSRVDLSGNDPSKLYPYRAAGKLYFQEGTDTYVCTASLVKRGVAVTAAHCVADFGKNTFYKNWQFIPAMSGNLAPYGKWKVAKAYALQSYVDGSDPCTVSGVVCKDDVAVLLIKPSATGAYPGTSVGWFGYGYNGFGFTGKVTQVSQLGYPVSHDNGLKMQRTDSQGVVDRTSSNNTVWGSRQTGGSSGGPEMVNLGTKAVLSGGATFGSDNDSNVVIGVTSWGPTSPDPKYQGASPFTGSNINALVTAACDNTPAACE